MSPGWPHPLPLSIWDPRGVWGREWALCWSGCSRETEPIGNNIDVISRERFITHWGPERNRKSEAGGLGQICRLLMPTSIYLLLSSDTGAPGPQTCGLGQEIYTIHPDICSAILVQTHHTRAVLSSALTHTRETLVPECSDLRCSRKYSVSKCLPTVPETHHNGSCWMGFNYCPLPTPPPSLNCTYCWG